MSRRVKMLVLRMDHCTQCIRTRYERGEDGNYHNVCAGIPWDPREFTEDELAAMREGTLSIPDWCPLEEVSGWIPVGEREPTERGTYEIAMPPLSLNEQHPHILVCEWAPAYGFHSEKRGTTFVWNADVLAWRPWVPLPDAEEAG